MAILTLAPVGGRLHAAGAQALPPAWTDVDVGAVGIAGGATANGGTFIVQGSGADVWGMADAFNYVYQPLSGDGTIVARVATISSEANWVKAGVMIRGSLSASSAQAFMVVSHAKGMAFQRRVSDDNISVSTAGSLTTAPGWVKLVRAGNLITGYESADGLSWTEVGTDSFTMGQDVFVGLAVSSHVAATLSTATFDNVGVAGVAGTTNQSPTVSLTSPASGAAFTAPATVSITATASDTVTQVDFYADSTLIGTATGTPYAVTWADVAAGTYSLAAVATDSDGASTTSSPVSITVQDAEGSALPPAWQNTDIGTTGAAGNSTYSAETFMIQGAGDVWGSADALQYAYLPMSGDGSITARVATISGPASWVKAGVMIRGSLSPSSAQAFMLTSVAKGMAFQRRASDGGTSVSTAGSVSTAPCWVRLTRSGDLVTAFESPDGTTWTAVASDSFATLPADVLVGLAVSSHVHGTLATATFDNVTTTAMPSQPPTVSLTSPADGASFTAPATLTLTASASDPNNQLTKVEFYNGTTLLGTDAVAPYSLTWSSVPAGTYSLTAVAYDGAGLNTRSAVVSVTVAAGASQPPTGVVFTASTDDATVTSYVIDVFAAGADPSTATPVASMDAGNPTPDASNNITVSAPSFFSSLPPGDYQLTVSAINADGTGRSSAIAFTR